MYRTHDGHLQRELTRLNQRFDELVAQQDRMEDVLVRLAAGGRLELLTTADVMRLLSIGRTKLHELVASGDLPMWKLGGERRITRAALEAFVLRRANVE